MSPGRRGPPALTVSSRDESASEVDLVAKRPEGATIGELIGDTVRALL